MKTKHLSLLLLAALAMGCGSDDDDDNKENVSGYTLTIVTEAPSWQVDYSGSEAAPDWTDPNPADYENWTIVMVEIEDALKPYVSAGDRMALFVGGELRGLASPVVTMSANGSQANGTDSIDATLYIMKVYGNEDDSDELDLTLCYYNSQLMQLFSLPSTATFDIDKVYGLDEDLIPQFTLGSMKYPVVKQLMITPADLQPVGVTLAAGDMLAVFVGEECRGVMTVDDETAASHSLQLTAVGRQEGEAYTLKYYNAAMQQVYTLSKQF